MKNYAILIIFAALISAISFPTMDAFAGDICVGLNCDDSDVCTIDSCDPIDGCSNTAISCDDSDVCTADACDPITGCSNTPICPLLTFTMGGWGTEDHGQNPGHWRDICFDNPGEEAPLPFVVGSVATRNLTFTSSQAIADFLPSGGKPGVLINGLWDPVGKTSAGNSAGQLTALKLNLVCSEIPAVQDPDGPFESGLGNLCATEGICIGLSVNEILEIAEDVIGAGGPIPMGGSFSQLNGCVAAINENFSGGGDNGFLSSAACP